MKALNKIFLSIGVAATALAFGSCTGDLDQTPSDPNTTTAADFSSDPMGYMEQVMGDVYLQFAVHGVNNNASVSGFDGGMSTFQRSAFILEEINTDEANWLPNDVDYGTFQYGPVPSNNRAILGTYSRFMINIACCIDFIQTVNNGYFGLNDEQKEVADEFMRQCRILKAGAYFYLIDCFGNVPWADENTAIGSVPEQLSRSEIFNLCVADLEAVTAEYGSNWNQVYGYVGKAVAEALLVKYYLNAKVYTGTAMYDKCLEHANNLINHFKGNGFEGSGLVPHYLNLFGANNQQYCQGGSNACKEIIWTIPQNATYLISWANSTFMIEAWIGESTDDDVWQCSKARYNAGDAWKCMTTRRQFVEKFEWNESDYQTSPDTRVGNWCTAANGFDVNNGTLTQAYFGQNGFLAVKFSNWAYDENGNIDAANSPAATTQVGGDYPVIRLAEIYLSAAEAMVGDGVTDSKAVTGDALNYLNLIRRRAGLSNLTTATFADLQDERARELYTENCRRTDLIRWGKWISGYTWNWKNQVADGADYPSYFTLYPLPSSIVELAHYTQNTGY